MTHAPIEEFSNGLDALIKNHKDVGCYNIGTDGIPSMLNEDDFIKEAKKLKTASKIITEKLKGKTECIHLKDYQIYTARIRAFTPTFRP